MLLAKREPDLESEKHVIYFPNNNLQVRSVSSYHHMEVENSSHSDLR